MIFYPRSVRVRLTLWFGAVLALVVLVFSVSIFLFVQARLIRQLNRQLQRDLSTVSTALNEGEEDVSEVEDYGVALARVGEGDRIIFRSKEWSRAELDKALKAGSEDRKEGQRGSVAKAGGNGNDELDDRKEEDKDQRGGKELKT